MKKYCFLVLVGLLAFVSNHQVVAQGIKAVPIEGRWDLTVDFNGGKAASWLEVRHSGIKTLTGHTNALYWTVDVLSNVDSQTQILVSGSLDQTIKLWNVKTGVCLNTVNAGIPIRSMTVIKSSSKQSKVLSG